MIGIITQPLGYNYGGILQNYALQQVLKRMGYNSITIDNTYRYNYMRYVFSRILTAIYKIFLKKRPFPPKPLKGRSIPNVTGQFIYERINIAKASDGLSIKTINKYKISTIIVGSDQVWRPAYNRNIYNMYLDFVPRKCKKIAYAASFGTNVWEYNKEDTENCTHLLNSFNGVSVRERSGVELVRKYLHYDFAEQVLDPTLLLEKSDYLMLCQGNGIDSSKYLCAYILDMTENKKTYIEDFAKKRGLKVRFFSAHDKMVLSVEDWLSNFRDASFVITDSFHGTVFSIIFEREFIVLPNNERGKDRFESLLSSLDLLDRMSVLEVCSNSIDWNAVKNKLECLRKTSYSFLKAYL